MQEDGSSSSCWTVTWDHRKVNIGYTLCIYVAFIALGWVENLGSYSLYDLMVISNTGNLADAVWFLRSVGIGNGVGTLVGGVFYDKFRRERVFGPCLLVLGCIMVAVPWCRTYWVLNSVLAIQGILVMVLFIGGLAEILSMWRENRISFLVLYLLLRLGRFTIGQIAKPFKLDYRDISLNPGYTYSTHDYSGISSNIYIPHSIIAGLMVIMAAFMFRLSCVSRKSVLSGSLTINERLRYQPRKLPKILKVVALTIMSACITLCTNGTASLMYRLQLYLISLPSFDHYSLWKKHLDEIMAVEYGIGMTFIVITIFLSRCRAKVIVGINCNLFMLLLFAFVITSLTNSVLGICISHVMIGGFQAVWTPMLFIWTNEYITPVTGKVSSFIVMISLIGRVSSEFIFSYLIDISYLWFCYLIGIEAGLFLLLCTVAIIMTRYIERKYGKAYRFSTHSESVDEVVSEQNILNEQ